MPDIIPKRVVLDTNICLDLFVFRDPRWNIILRALDNGDLQACTKTRCRNEWKVVLHYPHLPVGENQMDALCAEFDRYIRCIDPEPKEHIILPKCKDTDDQKFLEIARDAEADLLITKDKALLKLAKRVRKAGLFEIQTPEALAEMLNMRASAG